MKRSPVRVRAVHVASTLFLSAKTIENNLSRIYAKLGVRSRTELARALPEAPPPQDPLI